MLLAGFILLAVGLISNFLGLSRILLDWPDFEIPGGLFTLFGAATVGTIASTFMGLGIVLYIGVFKFLLLGPYLVFVALMTAHLWELIQVRGEEARVPDQIYEQAKSEENLHNPDRAAELYREYIDRTGPSPAALERLASCLHELERYREELGVRAHLFLLAKGRGKIDAGIRKALLLKGPLGDEEGARREVESLRSLFFNTPFEQELEDEIREAGLE